MAKIIAIVNQKGGVGKTTTTVNLTAALAALGKRVLLCDFDPQANATSGMGVDKNTASPNVYDVLINGADPRRGVVTTHYGDVLPSNKALAGAGVEMIALPDREHLLRKALEVLSPGYDFIFVDCPPSLELLTVNALCAADSLLVPVQCEYYALEGLSDLLSTVRLVKRSLNPRLVLEGVLLTMFDSRTNLSLQVAEEVKRHFPGQVYATVIPRNVRLSEAPSHGKPVTAYDPYSRGAEAYKLLRTNLMFALPNNNECRVIGITSALRGEGKSTTSVNLAYTIAQTGERVLMIEADMRLPNVAQRLALRPTLGLSDLLAGLCTREEAIQESGMLDNLRIIAAGSIPPNPMELLGSEQMTQQLAELKKEFDFIIFDLPPVNAVADGLVISRLVQGMVVVVRQDYGDRSSLSVAVRRLQYLNVKILGFVMTYSHAEKKAYKYRKYGYGYGYGYYGKKGKSSAADTNDDD